MTVRFLVSMLVAETLVEIKDIITRETIWSGIAKDALFEDRVKDWNFSKGHIIYI